MLLNKTKKARFLEWWGVFSKKKILHIPKLILMMNSMKGWLHLFKQVPSQFKKTTPT